MSTLDVEHSVAISHSPSLAHRQISVNVIVTESYGLKAEVAPGDFQVLDMEGEPYEYSIPSSLFSFDELRSSRFFDLFKQRILLFQSGMHATTRQYLVDMIVEYGMSLVSQCGEDDINLGFVVDVRLGVEYYRIADEEELAPYRLWDEMDDLEDDMDGNDDDEGNSRFRGVEKGRYNGGDGKEEAITCSVCLEDLASGMEFKRLSCSHIFHSSCIDPWLERNKTCPNCRTGLKEEDGAVVAIATFLRELTDR